MMAVIPRPRTTRSGLGLDDTRGLTLVTAGATFLAFLDTTVVNIIFPKLQESFPDEPISDLTWIATSYTVLFAALVVTAGRCADAIGRRRLFRWSVSCFTVASLGVACAPSLGVMTAARAVQGVGAAGMIPAALGLLLAGIPAERRAAAFGLWGGVGSVATAVGPFLSGGLAILADWRLVFAINIPVGLLMLRGTTRWLPADAQRAKRRIPDLFGSLLLTVGIGAMVFGVTCGNGWGWLSREFSPRWAAVC